MRPPRRPTYLALLIALVACSGDLAVPTEPLRLLRTEWSVAYLEEPFDGTLRPTGGLRPYRFELADGALPPGLELAAGRLVGTPTETGRFSFTILVQDGNLSQAVQRIELDVRPLPTPVVRVDTPATELRNRVPLVVRVEDARGWRGARIALTWDPEAFELVSGPTAGDARLAVFHEPAEGQLMLEMAALGVARDGAFDLARFSLRPLDPPARLSLRLTAASRYAGGEHLDTRIEGAPRAAQPPHDDQADRTTSSEGDAPDGDAAADATDEEVEEHTQEETP